MLSGFQDPDLRNISRQPYDNVRIFVRQICNNANLQRNLKTMLRTVLTL